MERLTRIIDDGLDEIYFEVPSDKEGAYNILDIAKYSDEEEKQEILLNIANKLAAYENLEQKGLLHKSPIPNGTIIYAIIQDIKDNFADDVTGDEILSDTYIFGHTESMYGEFKKDWFLTEIEAEEALNNDNPVKNCVPYFDEVFDKLDKMSDQDFDELLINSGIEKCPLES